MQDVAKSRETAVIAEFTVFVVIFDSQLASYLPIPKYNTSSRENTRIDHKLPIISLSPSLYRALQIVKSQLMSQIVHRCKEERGLLDSNQRKNAGTYFQLLTLILLITKMSQMKIGTFWKLEFKSCFCWHHYHSFHLTLVPSTSII